MPLPKPKLKDNPAVSPELKRILILPKLADSVATDVATLKTDINSLLTKLRNAGWIDS